MFISPIIFASGLWLVAAVCLILAIIVAFANHMGGATAPDSVDHRPTFYLVIAAVAFFVIGIAVA